MERIGPALVIGTCETGEVCIVAVFVYGLVPVDAKLGVYVVAKDRVEFGPLEGGESAIESPRSVEVLQQRDVARMVGSLVSVACAVGINQPDPIGDQLVELVVTRTDRTLHHFVLGADQRIADPNVGIRLGDTSCRIGGDFGSLVGGGDLRKRAESPHGSVTGGCFEARGAGVVDYERLWREPIDRMDPGLFDDTDDRRSNKWCIEAIALTISSFPAIEVM